MIGVRRPRRSRRSISADNGGRTFLSERAPDRVVTETETTSEEGAASAALIGATGGAGTTRCAVEIAATLARDGESVVVLDAAFATQGLSDYVDGRLDPDLTGLLTDEAGAPLAAGLADLDLEATGRVAVCPARAPFERLARAKSGEAARRFEERIEEAAATFDRVLVDTPPVAANQAIAAANACDRTALVAPAGDRGADAIGRASDRLADLGVGVDLVASNRGEIDAADVALPETDAAAVGDAPVCAEPDGAYATAVAVATEELFECEVASKSAGEGLIGRVGGYVSK